LIRLFFGLLIAAALATGAPPPAFPQAYPIQPDNGPGAGNNLGSKEAAQTEPDGYTDYPSVTRLVLAPMLQKNAGNEPPGRSPQDFTAYRKRDIARWTPIVTALGPKVN
jgi:tripartite-type tricarboxylate transporter receptor subunit TctC